MTLPNWKISWLTPQLPQRQDSLEDQLRDVRELATRAGCYDAADWIARVQESRREARAARE